MAIQKTKKEKVNKKNKNQYLDNFEKDQLIEVINMGAGNASTALSQMVNKKVEIRVPELFVDRIEKVPQFLGKQEEIMTGVLVKILGDAPGMMLLMFPTDSAHHLAGLLTYGGKKEVRFLDTLSRSALQEAGNILAGTSMNALSRFLGLSIVQSVPETATDMLGSVIDSIIAEIGRSSDVVLVFKVDFSVENKISGKLFFIFDPRSTAKILEITRKKISK